MIEIKKDTLSRVPVYMVITADGLPFTGIAFGSVTASVLKADGTTANITMSGTNWVEVTAGAFNGQGVYSLLLPASVTDVQGLLVYCVTVATGNTYRGAVKVVTNEEVDTKTALDAMRTDYTTVRAAKLDNLDQSISTTETNIESTIAATEAALTSDITTMQSNVTDLHDAQFGKWQVFTSGADANRLVLYRPDGTTVLKKFDLVDANGDATFADFFKRTPV